MLLNFDNINFISYTDRNFDIYLTQDKAIPLGGLICFNFTSSRKIEFCFPVSRYICFEVLLKVPEELLTALFINTRILKFKRQLTFAFFAAVNHLSGALRKQRLTSTSSKGHGL